MRTFVMLVALTCAGQAPDCNGDREVVYTVTLTDGRTVEVCGFGDAWEYPDCLVLKARTGRGQTRICHVKTFEYGVPTPAPPAENPKQ